MKSAFFSRGAIVALLSTVLAVGFYCVPSAEATIQARMTGGGVLICSQDESTRVTFGFELHCGGIPVRPPNQLEINWGGNHFHIDTVTQSTCYDEPNIPNQEGYEWDSLCLQAVGRYNGVFGAMITACFTDSGEPGRDSDIVSFVIHDDQGKEVLHCGGKLFGGNIQAHKDMHP